MGNPDKEREAYPSAPSTSQEEPPPPYTEAPQGDFSSGRDDDELIPPYVNPILPTDTLTATILFPPAMTVVHSISLTSAHLGVNSKDKRYHITAKTSEITLRSGPKKDSPTLAIALNAQDGKFGKTGVHIPREKGSTISFTMEGDHSNRQPFSIRIGDDDHLEHFEWRQSTGNEIGTVGQSKWLGYGWKLVRLRSPHNVDHPGGGKTKRSQREFGFTGDGKEIVAAAAFTNKFWKGPNFSFMGTGLTGTLGEVFEIVATITFLRVVWLQLQRSSHSGAPWWYNEEEHPGLRAEREAAEAGPSGT